METIQSKLFNNFHNKQYNEEQLILFLEREKYTEINVAEVAVPKQLKNILELKRFHIKNLEDFKTLFVGVDNEGNITYSRIENKNVDNHPGPLADLGIVLGCLIPVVAIVGLVIWFAVVMIGDVVENWNNYDDEVDTYEYNSDDKDSDGDVDYDDVEKYLNDSLEEDVNDGDDW